MAVNNGRILMRRGEEVNFDPSKMIPGEWAVSLDQKIIRMCVSPGVCIRIATYDAFEADLEQIRQILAECKTIQEAVVRINEEVSSNADAVVEYTKQTKQYRDEAEQFRNEAREIAGGNFLTSESTVDFTQASERVNISETDSVKNVFGKISKWFSDLNPMAGLTFGTLEELVQTTAKNIDFPTVGRIGDATGAWGPRATKAWYRAFIIYQNPYGSTYSLNGNGFLFDETGNVWNLFIGGNYGSTITISYIKVNHTYSFIGNVVNMNNIVDCSTIMKSLPAGSYIEASVNNNMREDLFNKGVIPVNTTGTIKFINAYNRGRIEFYPESASGNFFHRYTTNCQNEIGDYSKWFEHQ